MYYNTVLFYPGTRNGLSRMVRDHFIFEGYIENNNSVGFGRKITVNKETGGITVKVGQMTKGIVLNGYGCIQNEEGTVMQGDYSNGIFEYED